MESNKKLFSILLWIGITGSLISSVAIIYDMLTSATPLSKQIFITVMASNVITLSICSLLIGKNRKIN